MAVNVINNTIPSSDYRAMVQSTVVRGIGVTQGEFTVKISEWANGLAYSVSITGNGRI